MYSYIVGIITEKNFTAHSSNFSLENNGVAYLVYSNQRILSDLILNQERKIYLSTFIREDEIKFYGFLNKKTRDIFEILLSVSGLGPRLALSILNDLNVEELISAISKEDEKLISSVHGFGPKMAKKTILELKGKLTKLGHSLYASEGTDHNSNQLNSKEEVIATLTNLGFSYPEINRGLNQAKTESVPDEPEALIRYFLKMMPKSVVS